MKSKILVGLGVIVLLLIAGFYSFANSFNGSGGATQSAPDNMKTAQGADIGLELSVTKGDIKGRYTDVALFYKLTTDSSYKTVTSNPVPKTFTGEQSQFNGKYETYTFSIPPYPKGTKGEIEYYINLALDGHVSKIEGIKKIKITD